jgi:hypothetical protein
VSWSYKQTIKCWTLQEIMKNPISIPIRSLQFVSYLKFEYGPIQKVNSATFYTWFYGCKYSFSVIAFQRGSASTTSLNSNGIEAPTAVGGGETSPPFHHLLTFPHEDLYTSDPDSLAPSTSFSQVNSKVKT